MGGWMDGWVGGWVYVLEQAMIMMPNVEVIMMMMIVQDISLTFWLVADLLAYLVLACVGICAGLFLEQCAKVQMRNIKW